ncbi:MAG: tail fiber domain-containing protein [Planctomycetes bacterium]|nr:tail fiber domain-containing protein [Planctomycetota bacterium]
MIENRAVTSLLMVLFMPGIGWGTVITYQGHLRETGSPVNEKMDFQFSLWSAPTDGNQVSTVLTVNDVEVINGLFTVKLDFGNVNSSLFNGDPRWLQIALKPHSSGGPFTTMAPRQEITHVPYAIHALNGGSGVWNVTGGDIYYDSGDVGIGTARPARPLHIKSNGSNHWLGLENPAGTKWNFDYVMNPALGYNSALRIAPDNSPLQLYLPNEPGGMRMYLWTADQAVPNLPHTGIKPTFALWGDMLVGDIICIARNPMSLFFRQETNLSASSPVVFFCANKGINTDTDGGAGILLHPDHHRDLATWPNDPVDHPESGSLHLIAYGRGSGTYANKIRMQTRSGPGQVADRMVVGNGHVQIYGTIGATGGWISSREQKKDIAKLSSQQSHELIQQLEAVTYINKSDPGETRRVGFIAEEVPEIFAGPERKGVDYMGVAALLTKTVQEQERQIGELQARLAALEALVKKLTVPGPR